MSHNDSSSAKHPDSKKDWGKCPSCRPPVMCPPHQCLSPCSCKGFTRTEFDIQEYKRLVDSNSMPWAPAPMKRKNFGF
jgi:hypothetical protein